MTWGEGAHSETGAIALSIEWGGQDSNLRPGDYESFPAPFPGLTQSTRNPLSMRDRAQNEPGTASVDRGSNQLAGVTEV